MFQSYFNHNLICESTTEEFHTMPENFSISYAQWILHGATNLTYHILVLP